MHEGILFCFEECSLLQFRSRLSHMTAKKPPSNFETPVKKREWKYAFFATSYIFGRHTSHIIWGRYDRRRRSCGRCPVCHQKKEEKKTHLHLATASNPALQLVISNLQSLRLVEGEMTPFTAEWSLVTGVLLKENKVVTNQGRVGSDQCESNARKFMYWPRMTADISTFTDRWKTCKKFAYRQPEEPSVFAQPSNYGPG